MKNILVTGGAGYIGSHTVISLIAAGYQPIVFDNLCNSSVESIRRVEKICGIPITFVEGDIRQSEQLDRLFADHAIDAVLHFAGLKSVGESVTNPLAYFDNNVTGSVQLLLAMARAGVSRIVFSSSATVYAADAQMPVAESADTGPINPYGQSKLMVEKILADICQANEHFSAAVLRYFNPTGAHESGLIGEDPRGIPENLVPYVAQVATGKRESLTVFGGDYATEDGTGVRDYIHVQDLADGHVKALQSIADNGGLHTWNLGTGTAYSVLDIIRAYENASANSVAYQIGPRRPGDVAACWADTGKVAQQLGWRARFDLARMMEDNWRWQSANPNGYDSGVD